jgi:hypothetical protein
MRTLNKGSKSYRYTNNMKGYPSRASGHAGSCCVRNLGQVPPKNVQLSQRTTIT